MAQVRDFDRAEELESIRRIVLTYPEASDTGDLAGVGRFLGGVRMGHFGTREEDLPSAPAETVAEFYGKSVIYYPDGLSHAKHLITNLDIVLSEDCESARAYSTYVVLQARPELPLQVICAGRYDDKLRRVDGRWRLTVRRENMDLKGEMRFHVPEPAHLDATPHVRTDRIPVPPTADRGAQHESRRRPQFDRALATEQIRRIILAYPELVDRGDLAGLGLLLEGVRIGGAVGRDAPRVPEEEMRSLTASEVEAMYRSSVLFHGDGLPHTKHLITNIDVEFVDGGRRASARSYYTVLQGMESFPLQVIISGRYEDDLEATGTGWKLVARREYADLVGDLSHHVAARTLHELSGDGQG